MPRKFLVLQHLDVEDPGIFLEFFKTSGIDIDTIELDQGESIPVIDDYDALWVMGGPMDVWQEQDFPWLIEEKKVIRQAVLEYQIPYMGICLGHQLLASALGGEVASDSTSEVGIMPVTLTEQGNQSPFLQGFPEEFLTLQWHSAEVNKTPQSFDILASSPACACQSLALGTHAFSVQFHIEIDFHTIAKWNAIPAYQTALEQALGKEGVKKLEQGLDAHAKEFKQAAELLFSNWMDTVF